MSSHDSLEYAEWLAVRDTVSASLSSSYQHISDDIARTMASDLIVAGLVDVTHILGIVYPAPDQPDDEDEGDEAVEPAEPVYRAYILELDTWHNATIQRRIGTKFAIVKIVNGSNAYKVLIEDLVPVGDAS